MTSNEQIIENGNFIAYLAELHAQGYIIQMQDVQIKQLKAQLVSFSSHDNIIQAQDELIHQFKSQLKILISQLPTPNPRSPVPNPQKEVKS